MIALTPCVLATGDSVWMVPVIVAGIWGVMYRWTGSAWPRSELNGPIAALLLVVAASLVLSGGRAQWAAPKVATLAFGIAWFFALVRWHRAGLRTAWLVWGHVAAGLALTAIGAVAINWLHKVWPFSEVTALLPHYSLGIGGLHPNAVAGVLLLLIPMCIPPLVRGWDGASVRPLRRRVVAGAVLGAALGLLALTQSRGGWLGAAAMALVLLLYRIPMRRSLSAAPVVFAFGLACAVVAFWAFMPGATWVGNDLNDKWAFRLEMWRLGGLIIGDFPWTGVGFNGFRHLAVVLYPPGYPTQGMDLAHPHNMWLSAGADFGIPGIAAYLVLWAVAIREQITLATTGDRVQALVSQCLLAGWVGFWTFGIADAIPLGTKLGTALWLSLALAQCLRPRPVS